MRAAIYVHVSRDSKDTGRSVEEPVTECQEWVDRGAWKLAVSPFVDNDISASR